jgi:hypothetical protein
MVVENSWTKNMKKIVLFAVLVLIFCNGCGSLLISRDTKNTLELYHKDMGEYIDGVKDGSINKAEGFVILVDYWPRIKKSYNEMNSGLAAVFVDREVKDGLYIHIIDMRMGIFDIEHNQKPKGYSHKIINRGYPIISNIRLYMYGLDPREKL